MCGIVGLHGAQEDEWIGRMNAAQTHRGPDDSGEYRDREARLALATRRLAIIDIDGGGQPMSSPDGRYVLVYNGEIYNAPALRRELESAGEAFATDHSDTEVLLRLLMRHGAGALDRLNGMFAFALYDREAGTLFCARDRLGIKPFYYAAPAGRFAFASELKSLLVLPILEREVDRQSLFHYLSLMYVPGAATIVDGVHRLPPGCHLTYRLSTGTVDVRSWWTPRFAPDDSVDPRAWPERIRTALGAAVERWTLSDVPVACSLSGGLDSSALVGLLAQRGVKVTTFSLGFSGAGEDAWNELPLARAVADKWGTEHRELVLDPVTLQEDLAKMVWHLDEPYGGGLPSWSVFKAMGAEVKVGLTGTGGDELFGNYGKWRGLEGGFLAQMRGKPVDEASFRREFFDRFYYFADDAKRAVLNDGGKGLADTSDFLFRRYGEAAAGDIRNRVAATDAGTQLAEEFLMMTDRFSMAHSLEARTPFLDRDFVDLALRIPARIRTRRRDLKGLLRQAVAPVLPAELLSAPKRGFVIPLKLWLRERLRPLCERLLAPERLAAQGLIQPVFYETYVRPHIEGRADHTNKVWAVLMFQLWHMTFIEGNPAAPLARVLEEG